VTNHVPLVADGIGLEAALDQITLSVLHQNRNRTSILRDSSHSKLRKEDADCCFDSTASHVKASKEKRMAAGSENDKDGEMVHTGFRDCSFGDVYQDYLSSRYRE